MPSSSTPKPALVSNRLRTTRRSTVPLEEGDAVISDELNHASIIDGIRLTKASRHLQALRHERSGGQAEGGTNARTKVIITTRLQHGRRHFALRDIVELGERYGAATYVDDAHASGVLGKTVRGSVDHWDLNGRVDIQVGTFSKAIGAQGGYIACIQPLRDFLIHRARPFLFSNALPPSVVATCIGGHRRVGDEQQLIDTLWENTRYFKGALARLGST